MMAVSVWKLDVARKDYVRNHAVDDADELSDKKQDGTVPPQTGASATSEDYVEERYKVDRRKLEQMIQGKGCHYSMIE